ncbi:hypothetical protein [Rhizobium sp. GN54]|uniref:hypothetical protein n=1 Tax=Rhizobium sp. GN54 TaxID=2898150 RepID=UPI001E640EED|nr:hypothetical protein [Rhizobium sp. GN54]MCD2181670.1 hypothetical protein [Rhizobium sp. GN54]
MTANAQTIKILLVISYSVTRVKPKGLRNHSLGDGEEASATFAALAAVAQLFSQDCDRKEGKTTRVKPSYWQMTAVDEAARRRVEPQGLVWLWSGRSSWKVTTPVASAITAHHRQPGIADEGCQQCVMERRAN